MSPVGFGIVIFKSSDPGQAMCRPGGWEEYALATQETVLAKDSFTYSYIKCHKMEC